MSTHATAGSNFGIEHDTVCELCSSGYECGKLRGALDILKSTIATHNDPETLKRYETLMREIDTNGYQYPDSTTPCNYADRHSQVTNITKRVIAFIKDITRDP